MNHTLLWFEDAACQNPSQAGNKGAALAQLVAKGYLVPNGFCIPASSWASRDDPAGAALSTAQRNAISAALERLPGPWAVRSSSTVEDAKALSFAGAFTSILGLRTSEEVLNAVETVASRNWSAALRTYAAANLFSLTDVGMSVIIQTLVDAEVSGVAMSRHPVTGADVVIIEACFGLGDILVGGEIIPDQIEVDANGSVRVVQVGDKLRKTILTRSGITQVEVPKEQQGLLALQINDARRLARTVHLIELDMGCPQDVEWAYAAPQLFVLQSRPITGMPKGAD
jgi:phosphoenolpyruvate synthase/pyruvate phosphate dikinase